MTTTERRIRHLRLVAGTDVSARAAVTRIEDALRCASLPDIGARLLVVRRLALGDLGRQASSQAVARVIEARFTDRDVAWTRGDALDGSDESPLADHMVFRSVWHARVALTCRLLRGQTCAAWYWPLAVPEFQHRLGPGDNVRSIMQAIAHSQEATTALPAWATRAVEHAGTGVISAMVPAGLGEQLVRAAGLALAQTAESDEGLSASATAIGLGPVPSWLRNLLQREVGSSRHARITERARVGRGSDLAAQKQAALPAVNDLRAKATSLADAEASAGLSQAAGQIDQSRGAKSAATGWHKRVVDAVPTTAAGLLFLLPVLARLGLAAWAKTNQTDAAHLTHSVLEATLVQLRVPRGDPIWGVVADTEALAASEIKAHATDWVGKLRQCLRRDMRIRLAHLVRRSGWIALTPVHIDIFYRLCDVDMHVRQQGLDIDPGWLPWFGRVVAYHYGEVP